ncbi:MAG: phosphatidylserine decarboxylase family protein [Phycisphaerales bacterium]|nr:MAG: phosphatidylserine decarboxylase family protein [Phycisphaerales bacterium]
MLIATVGLGALTALAVWQYWPAAVLPVALWLFVMAFFRDPRRIALFARGELCSPADGKVTEITRLDHHEKIGGPAVRIGIFLGIFDVHANRSPCRGRVVSVTYARGRFLDARNPKSGRLNESNTLLIDPNPPVAGPIIVRQIAGLIARRITCRAMEGDDLMIGERFGMIKFGSRTELIIPDRAETEIKTWVGQSVRAGISVVAVQRSNLSSGGSHARYSETEQPA